jgi:hypothetical protein
VYECLDNLIGIDRRNSDTSESGRYLSDIEVTSELADSIANVNHGSGRQLLEQKLSTAQYEAGDMFVNAVRAGNKSRRVFQTNSYLEQGVAGVYSENLQTVNANSSKKRGVAMYLNNYPYVKVGVTSVSIMALSTGNIDVQVYDAIQNKLLDTITIEAIAGEISTTVVNKTYKSNGQRLELAFLFDGANATYKTDLAANKRGCRSCSGFKHNTKYCTLQGVEVSDTASVTRNNLKGSPSVTSGLSVTYNLECDIEPFICSIKNGLVLPILYKTASLVMNAAAISQRNNSKARLEPAEYYQERESWYEMKYRESLDTLINGIQLPNDVCFSCEPRVSRVTGLP